MKAPDYGAGAFSIGCVCWCDCLKVLLLAHHPHILGLRAFLTLCDLELDNLALLEVAESLTGDAGVMHEHVLPFLGRNKTITFLAIEPLHGALRHSYFIPPPGKQPNKVLPLTTNLRLNPAPSFPRPPPRPQTSLVPKSPCFPATGSA